MGLFDHLFKTQPRGAGEKGAEPGGDRAGNGSAPLVPPPPPDPGAFLRPRDLLHPGGITLPATVRSIPPAERRAESAAGPREVVVTLGDLLPHIPAQFFPAGTPDARRELRFAADDLAADIARGRASVPLSMIAARCADLFPAPIPPADDVAIRLPLQKLLDQLMNPVAPPPRPGAGLPADAGRELQGAGAPSPQVDPRGEGAPTPWSDSQSSEPVDIAAPISTAPVVKIENAVAEMPPPGDDAGRDANGEMIHLSLAAIIAHCPDEVFEGARPTVDDSVRLAFPFEPIERQLIDGKVNIALGSFLAVLPPKYAGCFRKRDGTTISLPLEEIFLNLPGKARPQHTAPKPTAVVFPELAEAQRPSPIVADAPNAPEPTVPHIEEPSATTSIEAPAPYRFFTPAPPPIHRIEPPAIVSVPTPENGEAAVEPQKEEVVGVEAASPSSAEPAPAVPVPVSVPPAVEIPAEKVPEAEVAVAKVEVGEPPPPPAATATRPTGFPPLRALDLRATSDAPLIARPALTILQSNNAERSPAPQHANAPAFGLQRPPLVRPLVVLPPPILGAASILPASPEPEPRLETTADQAAVLDFLSGTDGTPI